MGNALNLDDDFAFLDIDEDLVNERTLKLTREDRGYTLEIIEDGKLIHKRSTKDIDFIKHKLDGIENEVSLYWQDKNGNMNIRLNEKDNQAEIIQLVNYEKYPKDVIFRTTIERIRQKETKRTKVVDQKKASTELIDKTRNALLGIATTVVLGTGCVLYVLGLDKDKVEVGEVSTYKVEVGAENGNEIQPTESEFSQIALDSFSENYDQLENQALEVTKMDTIELYDQPLIPIDLNIYMYEMAEKYGIPYISLMTIAHVESDGKFDNHAKVGCSGDEGFMQINPANYPVLFEKLGFTPDQIKNDDKVNIECAAFILQDICERNKTRNGPLNTDEMYREYNGGGNFRQIPATLDYLSKINSSIEECYNADHLISVEIPSLGVSK
ncbi:MAG: lytic transglycosylase domain-containing protein [Bacilli bacterium]|nr:lytic transglycosylase domain-containing protein [Bacilli bacterium]